MLTGRVQRYFTQSLFDWLARLLEEILGCHIEVEQPRLANCFSPSRSVLNFAKITVAVAVPLDAVLRSFV